MVAWLRFCLCPAVDLATCSSSRSSPCPLVADGCGRGAVDFALTSVAWSVAVATSRGVTVYVFVPKIFGMGPSVRYTCVNWLRGWQYIKLAHSFEKAPPEREYHRYQKKNEVQTQLPLAWTRSRWAEVDGSTSDPWDLISEKLCIQIKSNQIKFYL